MQHTRLALLFLASVSAGIITLVACDTDNGTVPIPGGGSSGTGTSSGKTSSGSTGDDDTAGDDDTGPQPDDDDAGGDAAADCKFAPKLRTTTSGFFCGFYDGGTSTPDAGGKANCGNTQACCNPGKDGTTFPPSYCADDDPKGDAPPACAAAAAGANSNWVETGSSTWECASADNCPQQKCCATSRPGSDAGNYVNVGPLTGTGAPPKQCNAKNLFKVYGTRCADDCKTDKSEIELCSSTGKCSKSTDKCTPVRATGNRDLGACGP